VSTHPSEWHRSEPRAVRPFFAATAAEEAVHGSTIHLFEGSPLSNETTFDLDEFDLRRLSITINPVLADPKGWLPDGYKGAVWNVVGIRAASLRLVESI